VENLGILQRGFMPSTYRTTHLSVSIDRPTAVVHEFLAVPKNFERWAGGLGSRIEYEDGNWVAHGPLGPLTVEFMPGNAFGIFDHRVIPPNAASIDVPLRVLTNGEGSEVVLTMFHYPDMTDEELAEGMDAVVRDLATLKTLLES